jgi:hypothetical protein
MTNEPTDLFVPPPFAAHATSREGELFLWQQLPGLVAVLGHGVYSLSFAQAALAFYEPIIRGSGRLRVFADFQRVTEYTREARDLVTAHALQNRHLLDGLHMLLSSKMVALGVSSLKHEMGDPLVHTYADRSSFLRSFAQSIRDWESGHRPAPGP